MFGLFISLVVIAMIPILIRVWQVDSHNFKQMLIAFLQTILFVTIAGLLIGGFSQITSVRSSTLDIGEKIKSIIMFGVYSAGWGVCIGILMPIGLIRSRRYKDKRRSRKNQV